MKMTAIKYLFLLVVLFSGTTSYAQSCDSLAGVCKDYLNKPAKHDPKSVYISDGQVYRAFLDADQTAEFTTTFFGGSTYRIAATAGTKDKYIIFDVRDKEGNLLFSSVDYGNTPYWDFKVESTIDVVIEARLDSDKKSSGCAVMLIGFKQVKK